MKNVMTAGAALLLSTSIVSAGGIDRSGNAYSVLFEDGNYAQLSFSTVNPDVSGDYPPGAPPAGLGGGSTDNMAESYTSAGVALKYGINEDIDLAVFLNQPYGANANYTAGAYTGLAAEWKSLQLAVLGKYQLNDAVSVFGGLRAIQSEATIAVPTALVAGASGGAIVSPYAATANSDVQIGYVLGAAYEMPEIALRVSLTYESGVTHEFDTDEEFATLPAESSTTEIELPQSLALDFQTGVAADTLVFGSVRWAEWSVWEVRPALYQAEVGDRVTGIDNDVFTYRIGVGRRINEDLSVFARVTYEESTGDEASRLAPTDGTTSYGFGGSYTIDNTEISGGIEYAMLGDATDGSGTTFEDNTALGFGINIGFSF